MEPVQMERFYLGCLAHASYMIGSEGIAAVIDPQRDVDIYLEAAAERGWKIEHIIETHLHADFVSGHRELAERTGARIYLGAGSGAQFEHKAVRDGDEVRFDGCGSARPARRRVYGRHAVCGGCGEAGSLGESHAAAACGAAVPKPARKAADIAGRDARLSGAWGRVAVRAEPGNGELFDDRRAEKNELRAAGSNERGFRTPADG